VQQRQRNRRVILTLVVALAGTLVMFGAALVEGVLHTRLPVPPWALVLGGYLVLITLFGLGLLLGGRLAGRGSGS